MADKYHSDTQEKIETIIYNPGVQNTGDKEPGTHTIVPTARPAIGAAQYSHSLTLPKPADVRLEVKRLASRLNVNIAGLGTATHVYCSVRGDVDDADHELFLEDWTSIGSKLATVELHSGNKATLFNLLKDGAAHTFYFLFWADAASQATIDLVQLWEAVGCIGGNPRVALSITHSGLASFVIKPELIGSGSGTGWLNPADSEWDYHAKAACGGGSILSVTSLLMKNAELRFNGTVSTDLYYLANLWTRLRSEQ